MVMRNPFDLIGDTDIDDPVQIALEQKKAAAALVAAAADAAAAALVAAATDAAADVDDAELPLNETQKGVLDVPHDGLSDQGWNGQDQGWNGQYRGRHGQYQDWNGQYQVRHGQDQGWNGQYQGRHSQDQGWNGQYQGRHSQDQGWNGGQYQGWHGQDGRGRGPGHAPEDSPQELGKPSIRGHSDQSYRGRDGGGRGRGYLNRDNEEYADGPARRQYERKGGFSSPHAKVKGEPSPLVKDVPVPQVELGKLPEQNLEENVTLEGKSLIPKEPVELNNAPSSNALNKNKQGMVNSREQREPEVKVMTLGEYQKVLVEKRKTLVALKKTQERKVDANKEFESMQQLVVKKENNEFFVKLGNDKEAGKRKEDTDGDERVKKDTKGVERVKKDTKGVERVKKSVIRMFKYPALAEYSGRGGRGYSRSISDESIKDGQLPASGGRGGGGGRGYSRSFSDESIKDGQLPASGGRGGGGGRGYSRSFSDESIKDGQLPASGGRGGGVGRGYSGSFSDESIKDQFPAFGRNEVEQHNSAAWKKVEQQHSSAAAAQGKEVEQHSSAAAAAAAQGKKV